MQRELDGDVGKRERRGGGRLSEIRAMRRLMGVHLLLMTCPRKQSVGRPPMLSKQVARQ